MKKSEHGWETVTAENPCPICKRPDWCARSGEVVRCMRKQVAAKGWRMVKKSEDGGTAFAPSRRLLGVSENAHSEDIRAPPKKWSKWSLKYSRAISRGRMRLIERNLGITGSALKKLGIGWCKSRDCYTFPQRDHLRRVVGIATRGNDGKKGFIKGGHHGLHIPENLDSLPDPIWVVEGPSDAAACLSMGLTAIGRPNNYGAKYLAEVVGERDCIVVGDFDPKPSGQWPGKEGAMKVAEQLASELQRQIRWALAPDGAKDIREWLEREIEKLK